MLLFELKQDTHGAWSGAWSKWFGWHLRAIARITDRRLTFHSLRHTWASAAREAMTEEHRHAIGGWSGGGVGRTYGSAVPLKVLAESMAKVRFEGIDE